MSTVTLATMTMVMVSWTSTTAELVLESSGTLFMGVDSVSFTMPHHRIILFVLGRDPVH